MPIRFIQPEQTHPLRRAVLRPDQAMDGVDWPGDRASDSFHVGLTEGTDLVSIASFLRQRNELVPGHVQYRVRGMATAPGHRGKGHGSAILRFGVGHARDRSADLVWCNAREAAVGFYAREGFHTEGQPFTIEGIGIHHLMYLRL